MSEPAPCHLGWFFKKKKGTEFLPLMNMSGGYSAPEGMRAQKRSLSPFHSLIHSTNAERAAAVCRPCTGCWGHSVNETRKCFPLRGMEVLEGEVDAEQNKYIRGASLVAQWLRICLPMQGTWVRALVREDPTCRGATKPVSHNY